MNATAYAPAHITGFFKIYKNGSTGAGLNLEEGLTTKVVVKPSTKEKIEIRINNKKVKAKTSKSVVKKYLKNKKQKYQIKVFHKTICPIGFGLGISGAGAFSLSLALNKALKSHFSKKKIIQIANKAEIENGTGLGDVIAQQFSGIIRGLPPFPSKRAKKIVSKKKYCVCVFFSPINTSSIIKNKNWEKKINNIGEICMKKIAKKPSVENFLLLSRLFSVKSNLATKKVLKVMDTMPDATQAMLGGTAFVITNNPKKVAEKFITFSNHILISKIAKRGARVL